MKYLIVFFLLLAFCCERMNTLGESFPQWENHSRNRLKCVPRWNYVEYQDQRQKSYDLLFQFVKLSTNGSDRIQNVWIESNKNTIQRIAENQSQQFNGNGSSNGIDKFNELDGTKHNTDSNDIRKMFISNLCYFGFYLLFRCK